MDALEKELKREYTRAVAKGWDKFFEKSAAKYSIPVAALMAIASRETNMQNIVGDNGNGFGICQIDRRSHKAWIDTHTGGLNPETNIDYGASILRENLNAFNFDYKSAFAAYNHGISGVTASIRRGEDVDTHTTGHDYGANVVLRMQVFEKMLGGSCDAGGD